MKSDKILILAAIVGILIIVVQSCPYAMSPAPAALTGTVEDVYDGDTLTVTLESGAVERVRLIGIDAPELRTNPHGAADKVYGPQAQEYLERLVAGATVNLVLDVQERDRYGRILAYIYHGDSFINLEMVRAGYAKIATYPPNVAHADEFLAAEREARAEGRGLWGN